MALLAEPRPTANSMTMMGRPKITRKTRYMSDEGRAAVLAGDVGEAPDVAEADGAAGGDEDEPQTTAESLTFQ